MSFSSVWQHIPLAIKLFLIGAVAVVALIMLKPRPEPRPEVEPPLPEVRVVAAQPQTTGISVNTQGTVSPRRQIDLVSQVSGTVVNVAPEFVGGGFFSSDKSLVKIDPRDYQYALTRAEAQVLDAERALATERGLARQAQHEWRDLGNADANALFLRKPQIAAAEAQLAAARATRDQAQLNLERTVITAPFAGRISETFVDLGQFVSPGTRIASVYDSALAEVRLPLTDLQALLIDLPMGAAEDLRENLPKVSLHGVIAGQIYEWSGVITRTDASLDPQSRMYYAIVEIKEPFNTELHPAPLLMGMYVDATITGRPMSDVIQLPKSTVFRRDQIYTLDANNTVQLKTVRVLRNDDQFVWLQGDIAAGELVVLERQGYLTPGVRVSAENREADKVIKD